MIPDNSTVSPSQVSSSQKQVRVQTRTEYPSNTSDKSKEEVLGNAIVNQAQKESGTPDPNSSGSQITDKVTNVIIMPQDKITQTLKRTARREFEEIGAKYIGESLKRTFSIF